MIEYKMQVVWGLDCEFCGDTTGNQPTISVELEADYGPENFEFCVDCIDEMHQKIHEAKKEVKSDEKSTI